MCLINGSLLYLLSHPSALLIQDRDRTFDRAWQAANQMRGYRMMRKQRGGQMLHRAVGVVQVKRVG